MRLAGRVIETCEGVTEMAVGVGAGLNEEEARGQPRKDVQRAAKKENKSIRAGSLRRDVGG